MGTWGVSSKEIIERITDLLDNIEGDFSTGDLLYALKFLQSYAPTSNSNEIKEEKWRKKLNLLISNSEVKEWRIYSKLVSELLLE